MKESVTVVELQTAEKAIICYVQRQKFQEEIKMLQEGASNVKKGSSIDRLDLVLDDVCLRGCGCFRRTLMPEERTPRHLAKDHHV